MEEKKKSSLSKSKKTDTPKKAEKLDENKEKFIKAHPSTQIYEKYSRQYTAIIHTLIEYLPPKEKKNISRLAALRNGK